jgi:uncharacterized protein (DUF3820 family)
MEIFGHVVFINKLCNGLAMSFGKVCSAVITDLPEEIYFQVPRLM